MGRNVGNLSTGAVAVKRLDRRLRVTLHAEQESAERIYIP
jgi:hypothetical protein